MTTKIEITITENDDHIFIYVYKQTTLMAKFNLSKNSGVQAHRSFVDKICTAVGITLRRVMKNMLEGGD